MKGHVVCVGARLPVRLLVDMVSQLVLMEELGG